MNDVTFYTSGENNLFVQLCGSREQSSNEALECLNIISANTTEASKEKHIPVVKVDEDQVRVFVGSEYHPMTEEHNIGFVYLQTKKGGQIKYLLPNEEPVSVFHLTSDDSPVCAYAYCNLHGLWKVEIKEC